MSQEYDVTDSLLQSMEGSEDLQALGLLSINSKFQCWPKYHFRVSKPANLFPHMGKQKTCNKNHGALGSSWLSSFPLANY